MEVFSIQTCLRKLQGQSFCECEALVDGATYRSMYSRMDHVKLVEDSLKEI